MIYGDLIIYGKRFVEEISIIFSYFNFGEKLLGTFLHEMVFILVFDCTQIVIIKLDDNAIQLHQFIF